MNSLSTEKYNIYLKNKNALLGVFHENPQVNQPDYQFAKCMQDACKGGFGSRKICECVGTGWIKAVGGNQTVIAQMEDGGEICNNWMKRLECVVQCWRKI